MKKIKYSRVVVIGRGVILVEIVTEVLFVEVYFGRVFRIFLVVCICYFIKKFFFYD